MKLYQGQVIKTKLRAEANMIQDIVIYCLIFSGIRFTTGLSDNSLTYFETSPRQNECSVLIFNSILVCLLRLNFMYIYFFYPKILLIEALSGFFCPYSISIKCCFCLLLCICKPFVILLLGINI